MTYDLLSWLRATIEGDNATAEAATPGPWSYDPTREWYDGDDFVTMTNGQEFVGFGDPSAFRGAVCITGDAGHAPSMRDAVHIARHDPRDVMARCAAELRLIAAHGHGAGDEGGRAGEDGHADEGPCDTLRLLAYGYRHRPGWQPEWAPR
ncbi:DUF6221 family protein [Nonomuraea sp. NPDC049158]|uniref:DUF6221 family protein n=1 Tax=Nonomuraea sp. NPDC049158 TaxID=3155649 RepID=UPI0033D4A215